MSAWKLKLDREVLSQSTGSNSTRRGGAGFIDDWSFWFSDFCGPGGPTDDTCGSCDTNCDTCYNSCPATACQTVCGCDSNNPTVCCG